MMAAEPAVLPDDALVEVLRRLAPHSVAACRWVCKAWRDTIDGRLRRHLLSHSVRGIFINFTAHSFSEFFSRPSTGPAICGGLDFLPCEGVRIRDHCDGLVLCHDWDREYVVNPATRRWARLPQRPPPHMPGFDETFHLAFDHAVSPHYKVFLIPCVPYIELEEDEGLCPFLQTRSIDKTLLESEWPPASFAIHVFSSMTKRWDKTTFLREGEAAGVPANMPSGMYMDQDRYRAVYWRSVLYLHCQHGYIMRMSLSNHKYRVIRLPAVDGLSDPAHYLGRSVRGVYCALYYHGLQLWYLDESSSQAEWVLEHFVDFNGIGRRLHTCPEQTGTDWVIQDVNYRKDPDSYRDKHANREAPVEEKCDWNSDDDNILETADDVVEDGYTSYYDFLGFHPYKEVVFLSSWVERGFAYNWNTSKFQDLGSLYPREYASVAMACQGIDTYFPYTPCWMHDFPGNESESLIQDERQLLRRNLESQVEDEPSFTSTDEYELRKLRGRAKRVKDSTVKARRRRHHIKAQ